jgi:hypothetical protein
MKITGMFLKLAFATAALTVVMPLAHAETPATREQSWVDAYLTLQKPEVKAEPVETLHYSSPFAISKDCGGYTPMAVDPGSLIGDLGVVDVVIDKIINIGSKLWNIVLANAPVTTLNMPTASALPQGTQCWVELENWQLPKSQMFHVTYKNLLGMQVVNFSYRLVYTAGGSYNGAGQYLANVTVFPAKVDVAWGFKFDADVSVGDIMNLGSKTDPEAGLQVDVQWKVNTPFNSHTSTNNYFIRGSGDVVQL